MSWETRQTVLSGAIHVIGKATDCSEWRYSCHRKRDRLFSMALSISKETRQTVLNDAMALSMSWETRQNVLNGAIHVIGDATDCSQWRYPCHGKRNRLLSMALSTSLETRQTVLNGAIHVIGNATDCSQWRYQCHRKRDRLFSMALSMS